MKKRRYSVGTWDPNLGAFTPQKGLRCINLSIWQLRRVLRALRNGGYSAHRVRTVSALGGYDHHSDSYVLVERTDGMSRAEIIESWKR